MSIRRTLEPKSLFDSATELITQIEPRQAAGGVPLIGQPTGFLSLDDAIGGWRKGDMYAVAARTGGGKTAFCLGTGLNIAEQGGSVFYASLEMSAHMMALRSIAAMTGVPSMSIEKGYLKDETFRMVKDAVLKLKGLPIYFYDQTLDTIGLTMLLSKMQNEHGLDVSIVDYIALIKTQGDSGYERVTKLADDVKGLATDFDIPMITVSQLNRASQNRPDGRPQLIDFKETGQIENNSGAAIFPYLFPLEPGEEADKDVFDGELIIAKNRHGPANVSIPVEFHPKLMMWKEKGGPVIDPPQNIRR